MTLVTQRAAEGGHLESLKWLREEGCHSFFSEWNTTVCEGAASGGHIDVLKWGRETGCEWNHKYPQPP